MQCTQLGIIKDSRKIQINAIDRDYVMLRGHMSSKERRSIWDRSGKSHFIEIHRIEGNGGRLNFL